MALPASPPTLRFASRSDLPAISGFLPSLGGPRFSERFPGRTLPDFLDWKYFRNPLGEAVVAIATDAGRVVGLVAATPKDLFIDHAPHAVCELGDFLTDERYRGRGIFSQLIEATCAELTRRKVVLAYVRPNENSFPILVRHGSFTEPRQIDQRRFVLPSEILAQKLARPAAWLGRLGADWAALRWAIGTSVNDIEVRPIARFGPEHDRLWQTAGSGYRLAIGRGSRYLNWRYVDSPTPFLLWDARRGEETAGFLAAFVSPSSRTGYIVDLFARPDDDQACAALMATWFRSLGKAGVGRVYGWRPRGEPQSAADRVLLRACPLGNRRPMHFAVRVLDPHFPPLPPSGWQLGMGDFDGV